MFIIMQQEHYWLFWLLSQCLSIHFLTLSSVLELLIREKRNLYTSIWHFVC